MASTDTTKTEGARPARRTIVKGAAWAVPAVAVASAAPAYAASPCISFTPSGDSCKYPGDFRYLISWCVDVTCRVNGELPTEVRIRSIRSASKPLLAEAPCAYPITITLDSDGHGCSPLCNYTSEANANQLFITYDFGVGTTSQETPNYIPAPPNECDFADTNNANESGGETTATVEEPAANLTVQDPATKSGGTTEDADTESSTASPQG